MLMGQLNQQLAAWKQILSTDVPAFNNYMKSSNIPALYLPPEND
jgi:hypothetical protein